MFNPFRWSPRASYFMGFLFCVGLMAYAYYAQFQLKLDPCPLCIFQRVAVIALGVVFLVGALHNPGRSGWRVYGIFAFLAAASGAAIAGWHVHLQNLPPDQVPDCGPGLDYMLGAFEFSKTLKLVFTGSGECTNVDWTLLGLSMPAWTLICFVALALFALIKAFSARNRSSLRTRIMPMR